MPTSRASRLTTAGLDTLTSFQVDQGDEGYDTPAQVPGHSATASSGSEMGPLHRAHHWKDLQRSHRSEPIEYNVTSYYGPQNSQTFRGTIYYPTVYEVVGHQAGPSRSEATSGSLVVTREVGPEAPQIGRGCRRRRLRQIRRSPARSRCSIN